MRFEYIIPELWNLIFKNMKQNKITNQSEVRKAILKAFIIAIIGFILTNIVCYLKLLNRFKSGIWSVENIEGNGYVLFVNGAEKPLIWLLVGPQYLFLFVSTVLAFFFFYISLISSFRD